MASGGRAVAHPGGRLPGRLRGPGASASPFTDARVERALAAVSCLVLVLIAGMVVFVFQKAWPSFANNGLGWFAGGDDVDFKFEAIINGPANPAEYVYEMGTFPMLWGTFLTAAGALVIGVAFALFSAIFIVEFAPPRVNRVLEPVVRLLAAVPSVVYGLIGVLVLVPFVAEHLISDDRRASVAGIIDLNGGGLIVMTVILAVMITPIMIAIIVDALRAVPSAWTEGAAALGVNRWRIVWTIGVRTVRPAIIAAAVLATARAIGEAIMLSMISSKGFAPNPFDGLTFFLEPTRTAAASIIEYQESSNLEPVANTLYALAAILLISSVALSLGGYFAKQPLRKYGVRP